MLKHWPLPEYAQVKHNKNGWLYYNAILELLKEYPVEKVSVQMVLDITETSRGTFYKYFSDKYALMHYVPYYDVMRTNVEISVETLFGIMRDELAFYKNLFSYEGQNSFREFFRHFWMNNCRNSFIEQFGEKMYTQRVDSTLRFYVDGLYGLMRDWVLSDCRKLSDKELIEISRSYFPNYLWEESAAQAAAAPPNEAPRA